MPVHRAVTVPWDMGLILDIMVAHALADTAIRWRGMDTAATTDTADTIITRNMAGMAAISSRTTMADMDITVLQVRITDPGGSMLTTLRMHGPVIRGMDPVMIVRRPRGVRL